MTIFDEIDGMGLLEEHVQDLLLLEEQEARRILEIYHNVRGRLRRRLRASRADSFTEQQLRVVLAQVEGGISALNQEMTGTLGGSIESIAGRSAEHLALEAEAMEKKFLGSMQRINVDAVRVASQSQNYLFNRYQTSINTYASSIRQTMATGLGEMVVENVGWDAMVGRMMKWWGDEEWRLRRIVRTELHNVYGQSKLFGMRDLRSGMFPDLKKTLYHPLDKRTAEDSRYVARSELVVNVDEPFRYQWPPGSGRWRIFMNPPDRPNDRSILIPFRHAWAGRTAEEE